MEFSLNEDSNHEKRIMKELIYFPEAIGFEDNSYEYYYAQIEEINNNLQKQIKS